MQAALVAPWISTLGLLLLCAPYLQGAWFKLVDFQGAVAEVRALGLAPAAPLALLTAALQLGASTLILSGWYRWLGALALACFTLLAAFLADRFWRASGAERRQLSIAFCEHGALAGAMLLLAAQDLRGLHV